MKKRRLLSAVTALVMIITSLVTGNSIAYADDAQALPGIFTILDYGSTPLSLTMGNGRDYHVTEAEEKHGISGYQNIEDWTEYDYVNIQLKVTNFAGELEKQGFNMIFGGTTNVGGGRYTRVTVYATAEKSVFSIPVSDLQYGMSLSPTKNHIEYMKFNTGNWSQILANGVDYNAGSTVSIEKIYLTTADYGKPMNVINSNVKDGDGMVDPALGGNRTFEFDLGLELLMKDYQDAFELYEDTGAGFVLSDMSFTVSAEGSVLKVKLEEDLKSPMTYRVIIKPDILRSVQGAVLSQEHRVNFAVGKELDLFKFRACDPGGGAEITGGGELTCTLEFNNAIDESQFIPDYVLVYADGVRVFDAYTYDINENELKLKFNDKTKPETEYTIKLSGKLKNVHGKSLDEGAAITFTSSREKKEKTTFDIFSTANPASVALLSGGGSWKIDTEECNYNSSNIKLTLNAGREATVYPYSPEGRINPDGMNYFNMFMYSPAIEGRGANCIFYTSRENNKYYRYSLSLDWEGWKLVSIPLNEINQGAKDSLDVIMINFGAWDNPIETNGYVRIESMWLSRDMPEEPELLSVNIPQGYADAKLNCEYISFTFEDTVFGDVSNIAVTDAEGNVFEDYTAAFDEDKINLKFGSLNPATEYKIAISDIKSSQGIMMSKPVEFSFTTAAGGVSVSKLDISESENGYKADFGIDNRTEEENAFECVAVAYDENGEIIADASETLSIAADSAKDLSLELAADNAEYIKAYAINESGQVVSNRYVTLRRSSISDNDAFDVKGSAEVTIDEAKIDINLLSVIGTTQGSHNTVVLEVAAPDGTIVTKEPISADENGKFVYNMVLGAQNSSGMYTVTAASGRKSQSRTIGYISSSDRAEFLNIVKKKDVGGIGNWFGKYKTETGMSSKSSAQLKDMAECLAEHSYKTYKDAHDMTENIVSTLDGLNGCTWTNMWKFIKNNHTILLENESDDYKYLNQNSEKTVNTIMSRLVENVPFATISDFRAKLAKQIKNSKESDSKPQTITGSGGSGSGSGSGSGKSSSIVVNNDDWGTNDNINNSDVFVDIDGYAWAKESVAKLVKNGVVAVGEDRRFRPGENILREEFVKMIIEAFCSNITDNGRRFADEKDGMWYNKYLNTAYVNGFVSGHDDGTFGVGECITREDMVTIVCRILENLGNSLDYDTNTAFADSNDISEYAKAYVAAMSNAKVVNGVGNDMFAPKNNATRAEAAVIIAKVIELYK